MRVSWLLIVGFVCVGAAGCEHPVARYCSETKPCSDPALPFCDLTGAYEPDGIRNTCVPNPFDASIPESDAALPDAALPERIVQVVAGGSHSCALTSRGRVRCWGLSYQLGFPTTENIGDDELPSAGEDVPLPEPARQIAASDKFTCALTLSNRVLCWGGAEKNNHGQLGTLEQDNNTPPTHYVQLDEPATAVSVGSDFACARMTSGAIKCWGRNTNGQLGTGTTDDYVDVPPSEIPAVALQASAESLSVAGATACAVLEGGTVSCWGNNNSGQLGLGHVNNVGDDETPAEAGLVNVAGLSARVAVGPRHACALGIDAQLRCWGWNEFGVLGIKAEEGVGDEPGEMPPPPVQLGADVQRVGSGWVHACAILSAGTVRCWGFEDFLGVQATENIGDDEDPVSSPVIDFNVAIEQISVSPSNACALTTDGGLRCFGANFEGALGYGTTETIGDDESPASWGDVQVFPDL